MWRPGPVVAFGAAARAELVRACRFSMLQTAVCSGRPLGETPKPGLNAPAGAADERVAWWLSHLSPEDPGGHPRPSEEEQGCVPGEPRTMLRAGAEPTV